jgi:hypothetical protein
MVLLANKFWDCEEEEEEEEEERFSFRGLVSGVELLKEGRCMDFDLLYISIYLSFLYKLFSCYIILHMKYDTYTLNSSSKL